MEVHNKIINNVAKRVLKQNGLFRVGSTRTWIEDNGYYFTIVSFEQSQYRKGCYLNVGIDFLWGDIEENNSFLKFEIGGREIVGKGTQYVEYKPNIKDSDIIFERKIEEFANTALTKVIEYRTFRDLELTKEKLLQLVEDTPLENQFWELYRLSMLCFFKGDFIDGKNYFNEFLENAKKHFYVSYKVVKNGTETTQTTHCDWAEYFYNYCVSNLVPQLYSSQSAQKMVYEMINRRRAIFSSKSSYKNMNKEISFTFKK